MTAMMTAATATTASADARLLGWSATAATIVTFLFALARVAGASIPTHTTFLACGPVALVACGTLLVASYKLGTHPATFNAAHALATATFIVLLAHALRYH